MPNRFLQPSQTPEDLRECFNTSQYRRSLDVENEVGGIVVALANTYAEITGSDPGWIADIFSERTNGLLVYTDKNVDSGPGVACFTPVTGSLIVSENILGTDDYEYVLAHEAGHAVSMNKIFEPTEDYEPVGHIISGVDRHYDNGAGGVYRGENDQHASWWLNESTIDLLAHQATGSRHPIGYLYGGAVLSAYFRANPDLEKEMYLNIFFVGNTDRAIGVMDAANYSGWTEEVGEHIRAIENWRSKRFDLETYNPFEEIKRTLPIEILVLEKQMLVALSGPSRQYNQNE